MVNCIINGIPFSVKENTTVLDACKQLSIDIPTLCYLKDVCDVGACRICLVEIKGLNRLVPSCNTEIKEGMEIITDSEKVINARKTNLSLILSKHNVNCKDCVRNDNCELKILTDKYSLTEDGKEKFDLYGKDVKTYPWDNSFPFIKDQTKCISCMRCLETCDKLTGLSIWKVVGTGNNSVVVPSKEISFTNCSTCAQCVKNCPTAALTERDDTIRLQEFLDNKDLIKVAQIAPAVRTAYGEDFNLSPDVATDKKLVSALKNLGFDYVFDTDFSADLVVMEESFELLKRLPEIKKSGLPMFTSCCPAWVKFIYDNYPEFISRVSSVKSPQEAFGTVTKSYFAKKLGVAPEKIVCVSVMPCVAKKRELTLPVNGGEVDLSITTRELTRFIKKKNIDVSSLKDADFDSPFGESSGAGVIFGTTGGVTEAALRTAYHTLTCKNPDPNAFYIERKDGITEKTFNLNGNEVKVAVVSGLKNAEKLLNDIKYKKAVYDFVEVMACPKGCVSGGGQPYFLDTDAFIKRADALRNYDKSNPVRFSHENPEIISLYNDFLKEPCSEISENLLHVKR